MGIRVAFLLAIAISAVAAVPASTLIEHINSVQHSWTAGINSISDKSDEYKKRLCGVLHEPGDTLPVKEDIEILENIPVSFDARKHWPHCPSISSVKDQGICTSGWAIAATSSLSDRLCIATHNKVKVNISEENLTFCCSSCVDKTGCDGGRVKKAWQYIQNVGVVTGGDWGSHEGCQPYEKSPTIENENYSSNENDPKCEKICTNLNYKIPYVKDLHYSKNAYSLPPFSEEAIQSEILKYGPVEATFKVYKDFFYYASGVYQQVSKVYCGDQAVRVLGWGTENGTPYWLAANSWGRNWGDNGLFKILRGSNECDFEEAVFAGQAKH